MFNLRKWTYDGRPLANPFRIIQRIIFLALATPFVLAGAMFLFLGGFWDAAKTIVNEIRPYS